MTKLHKQHLIILSSIGAIVLGGGVFGSIFLQNKIVEQNSMLSAARIDTVRAETEQSNRQVRKLEYERFNESIQSMDAFFVSVKDILSFISSLERIAEANRVRQEIQSLQPPQEGVNESTISLYAEGSLNDVRKYLSAIESSPTLIDITSVSFQSTGTPSSESALVRISIEATLQWQ